MTFYKRSKEGEERRIEAVRNRFKGKTYKEIYGEKKALDKNNKMVETRMKNKSYKRNSGSFKKGMRSWNYATKIRVGKYILKTKKHINASHIEWCKGNQISFMPPNCIIHHIDFNVENNNPNNLLILDRRTHMQLHHDINKFILGGMLK